MDKFRDILLTLVAFGTVASFLIKFLTDLFTEVVKFRYKSIPGKQSYTEVIVKWCAICVSVLSIILYINQIYLGFKNKNTPVESSSYHLSDIPIVNLIAVIIIVIWFYNFIATPMLFIKLNEKYVYYFEHGENEFKGKWTNKVYRTLIKVLLISSAVLCLFFAYCVIESIGNEAMELKEIISNTVIGVVAIVSFIISLRLNEIIKILIKDEYYTLHANNEIIYCKTFLEYSDYYLIFENGVERFIKKGEIKEIRKIHGDKIQHNITKRSIK